MPGKKSGGTGSGTGYEGIGGDKKGFEQPKRNDQGQGGFDKDMNKNIGTDRDVNAPKHGSENLDREDEGLEGTDEPSKPELPRE